MEQEFDIVRAQNLPLATIVSDNDMLLVIQGTAVKRVPPSLMKGRQGEPGLSAYLGLNDTSILWKQGASGVWQNLVSLEKIRGPKGEKPLFRKVGGTLQLKYENEPDSAYKSIFDREELKMKFSDLTVEERDLLTLHFSDLTAADKTELMKPATDAAKAVTEKMAQIEKDANQKITDLSQLESTVEANEETRKTNFTHWQTEEQTRQTKELERQEAAAAQAAAEAARETKDVERNNTFTTKIQEVTEATGNATDAAGRAEAAAGSAETQAIAAEKAAGTATGKAELADKATEAANAAAGSAETQASAAEKAAGLANAAAGRADTVVSNAEKTIKIAEKATEVANASAGRAENAAGAAETQAGEAEKQALEAKNAAAAAQEIADHPNYVGENFYVYKWNKETKAYDKTDIFVKGDAFSVKKVYASVAEMEADLANPEIKEGDFVLINTNNVEDPDNAQVYIRSQIGFDFIVDMSGAIGFTGKTPQFRVGNVTTGVEGSAASLSLSEGGTDGDGNPVYLINLSVPRGDKGKVPIINIGTITTVDPGGAASAQLVPDGITEAGEPKYILNMSIPKGDKGGLEDGDALNLTVTFDEASTRENIATGEKMSVLFGKIKKFFSDLKTVAFTGKFSDLIDTPTTVDGYGITDASKTGHKHTKGEITDFPTSMPASDVPAWAKAGTKPTYTAGEVGASPSNHNHDSAYQPKGSYAASNHNHTGVYEPVFSKNSAFNKNFGTSEGTVCQGNDSRLSNARPASDVPAWAKAGTKPTYTASEVGAAASNHNHDSAYQSKGSYAAANHNHSGVYEPAFNKNNAFNKNFGSTAGTICQGDDARLSNARPASDVPAWAKAAAKPTYTAGEVGAAASNHNHDSAYQPKGSYAAASHSHGDATQGASGFMSAADKKKLDRVGTKTTATTVTNLNMNYETIHVTLSANASLSANLTGTAYDTWETHVFVQASGGSRTVTIPTSGSYISMCGSSVTIPSGKWCEFSLKCIAGIWHIAKLEQE